MGWLTGWWRGRNRAVAVPLYDAVVARARQPHWYVEGGVPDTLDGRFDMVAAVLCAVLLRLEEAPDASAESIRLTERFVDDMDAQVRQIGFGDMVVGKHVGRMMGMLGGRLGAYRDGFVGTGDPDAALVRNLYRGETPLPDALRHTRESLRRVLEGARSVDVATLMRGELP